jgi:hypothetical protein
MKRTSLSQQSGAVLALLVAISAWTGAGCAGDPSKSLLPGGDEPIPDDPTEEDAEKPGAYAGGEENTFNHMSDLGANGARDAFEVLAQRQEEGPPEIRTRLHSCQKLQITTLRTILEGFGVDLAATGDPPSAGQLFNSGGGALGAANYDARVGETIVWSAAGAAKLFDIFVQAAPEIIANLSTVPQCQMDGVGPEMFDGNGQCNEDAITCLIGRPATPEHLAICNSMVHAGTTLDNGKYIAVATLLSAAHSCE